MSSALVFSIEEFSVFDGPGIRTSVFLAGCPLRCEWCQNPEGQSFENQILRSPNGCIGCGECRRRAVREHGELVFTEDSINHCPRGLLRYCAKSYSAAELCDALAKNITILNSAGGGVTFSGGEPTAHPAFLVECLSLLAGRTHRAVQTCGYCSPTVFADVLDNCEYVLYDLKLVDDSLHKRYTGVSNRAIIDNFRTLAASRTDFVIRTPLIPTVTDTESNLRAIASLLKENGVSYIELLPYNQMAGAKYRLAGKAYVPSFDETAQVSLRTDIFAEYGIRAVKI